ncbi:MAG: alpha/beta hydrolase family protein, partial [Planctomyces sp.]
WPVLSGVTAEGLLLVPARIRGAVVLLPDAAWTPEMLCGVSAGAEVSQGVVSRLAAVDLLVPWLRSELGDGVSGELPIGVGGVGEGGRIALAAAAVDERICSCWVAGYFQQREGLWQEPLDRNVWRMLTEFGDAEQAGMVAPRRLVLEACRVPEFGGVKETSPGRVSVAAPGRVEVCRLASVRAETERARKFYTVYGAESGLQLVETGLAGAGLPGTSEAVQLFLGGLWPGAEAGAGTESGAGVIEVAGAGERLGEFVLDRERRQLDEMQEHVQRLIRGSQRVRDGEWLVRPGEESGWPGRQSRLRVVVRDELIGRLPHVPVDPRPRSRRILETAESVGYEVWLEVFEDVLAGGVLLLPRGLGVGEQRAVVVCQHGLEGAPLDTISREPGSYAVYRAFGEELVRRGYIVFAPQNPYRGGDDFRELQRMSNPLGRSLFSLIVSQHQQLLRWLKTVPGVDADRIGFYGLSYGGKTAMRVPALLEDYSLSICSGDFTDWPRTIASNDERYSYVFTGEYEIPEWNLAHVASYAELAQLISPRPFMVEAGHRDGGQPTELVFGEFGRVRRHYDRLGLSERAELEFFDGPHQIHGVGTYRFLDRHLRGVTTEDTE